MTSQTSTDVSHNRIISYWLFLVAAMVFAMVVLGGVTRLTGSGLSMVEWHPVTGWLPPFADADWQRIFRLYQETPEFREVNSDMTVAEFKGIFWLEFLHRLWGRLIGIAYFVPFLFFLTKGWVRGRRAWVLAAMLVLGGAQGALGWFMVKSGLVDRPDVSQYRLAAHLILAMVIYAGLIWTGLRFLKGRTFDRVGLSRLRNYSRWVVVFVFVTAFSGALVAGLNAGLSYNTFPLMDGEWIPSGGLERQPIYLNFFENPITVQFDHRVLAMFTFGLICCFWVSAVNATSSDFFRPAVYALGVMACFQVVLGVSTLLLVVPFALAALHQAGAVLLLGFATWSAFELQAPCRG